jgi:hypothetical protein
VQKITYQREEGDWKGFLTGVACAGTDFAVPYRTDRQRLICSLTATVQGVQARQGEEALNSREVAAKCAGRPRSSVYSTDTVLVCTGEGRLRWRGAGNTLEHWAACKRSGREGRRRQGRAGSRGIHSSVGQWKRGWRSPSSKGFPLDGRKLRVCAWSSSHTEDGDFLWCVKLNLLIYLNYIKFHMLGMAAHSMLSLGDDRKEKFEIPGRPSSKMIALGTGWISCGPSSKVIVLGTGWRSGSKGSGCTGGMPCAGCLEYARRCRCPQGGIRLCSTI